MRSRTIVTRRWRRRSHARLIRYYVWSALFGVAGALLARALFGDAGVAGAIGGALVAFGATLGGAA